MSERKLGDLDVLEVAYHWSAEKSANTSQTSRRPGGVHRAGGSRDRGGGETVPAAMTATDPDRLARALADLDVDELDPAERDRIAAALEGARRRRHDRKAWIRHELGRRLRAARGDRTQREIAEAAGTTEKNVSRWETGERTPDDENRERLADVLGVELAHLHPELERGPS